jgi:acetylornithine/succinyldiaminopimelate/putrescine aminotransferase
MWKLVNNNWEYLAIDEEPKKETESGTEAIEVAVKSKKTAKKSRAKAKTV